MVGDNGNPERYGELSVRLLVDRDRQDPRFDRSDYYVTIPETTPVNNIIETVRATDDDLRQFPVRQYFIYTRFKSTSSVVSNNNTGN